MIDDLKFSGQNPVVINYNGSASDVFAPVKSSSCDINIVSPHILDDLYTAEKDRVVVQVHHKEYDETTNPIYHQGSCVYTDEFAFYVLFKNESTHRKVNVSSVLNYFKDVDGVWNFIGYIDNEGTTQSLIAYYDKDNDLWIEENKWNLGVVNTFKQIYFHDGEKSYKIDNTASPSQIFEFYKQGRDWEYHSDLVDQFGDALNYGDLGALLFYRSGVPGLLFQEKWWLWDSSREMFLSMPDLQFKYQNYFYGKDVRKVYLHGDMIYVIPSAYQINPNTGEMNTAFMKFNDDGTLDYIYDIPYQLSTMYMWSDEDGNIFSMTDDDIYSLTIDKETNYHAWVRVGNCELHREPTMAIGNRMYMSIYHGGGMVEVTQLPWIDMNITRTYSNVILWEGYMTPNTYSQELTQNLDQISLTAIDPVAMMKYVKIDNILTKPNVLSYRELIGKALAYVALDVRTLFIEDNFKYDGVYGLLDMRCQVSNFWDEGGEPATLYEMIEELLRPFCLTLTFGKGRYCIIDASSTSESRKGSSYYIADNGDLNPIFEDAGAVLNPKVYDKLYWKSNNVSSTDMTISSTYDKVPGVASTSIPSYSTMAFDLVDSNNRNLYDAGWLNVDRNKAKGFIPGKGYSSDPDWFYIWNGVYTNPDYKLESYNGLVNGWLNINKAYRYLSGENGNPNDYGSILNFYGGSLNPTGTGREQAKEKSVEIKKRITAYAPDNGIPPEFMERDHIHWYYTATWDPENIPDPDIAISYIGSDAPYGTSKSQVSSTKCVYYQSYENMQLDANAEQVIDFSLTHSYSRTGIDTLIPKLNSTIVEDKRFFCWPDNQGEGGNEDYYMLSGGTVYAIPWMWDSDRVSADYPWANNYSSSGKCTPIWDKRMIMMYIKLERPDESGYTYYQFNGKDWVGTTSLTISNAFYLKKLMNYNKVFHNDIKYNLIECADGTTYSLKDERIIFYKDRYGGVVQKSVTGGSSESFPVYYSSTNDWFKWLKNVSEGELSIVIPDISAINATVVVSVYNSTLLGSTLGHDGSIAGYADTALYRIDGSEPATYIDPDGEYQTSTIGARCPSAVGQLVSTPTRANWDGLPPCVSYFKAEHLDLSIEVTVPESNLGQMFSESDVKYTIDRKKNYLEEYEGPTFRVNTAHPLVKSSFSYLICEDELADPDKFVFKETIATRPECYVVQAYMNLLSKIRKVYNKTIKLFGNYSGNHFGNTATYIKSPEIEKKMMVLGDSYDVKTNRHTIEAIEDYDMDVTEVESFATVEIPRKARNSLFNLPSAKK